TTKRFVGLRSKSWGVLARGKHCRFLPRLGMARKLREHESTRSGYRVAAAVALALAGSLWGLTILGGVMIIFGALYFSTRTWSQRSEVPTEVQQTPETKPV